MPDRDLTGGLIIAMAPQTLRWATDQMVETLGPEKLKKLKVQYDEPAIILTAIRHVLSLASPPGAAICRGLSNASARPTEIPQVRAATAFPHRFPTDKTAFPGTRRHSC